MSRIFYIVIHIYLFIISTQYNYVYSYGYDYDDVTFTVPVEFCSFYVGFKARNPVVPIVKSASQRISLADSTKHSFSVPREFRASKYKDLEPISSGWNFGKFKIEYAYSFNMMKSNWEDNWDPVGSTDANMKLSTVSYAFSTEPKSKNTYFGIFRVESKERRSSNLKSICVTDRYLSSSGGEMNFAPLIIGHPVQKHLVKGRTFKTSKSHASVHGIKIKHGSGLWGQSERMLALDPSEDRDFTNIQKNLVSVWRYGGSSKYTGTAKDVGGRFKIYAGLLFFHRVRAKITNEGLIKGYYGISASCPIPYNGKLSNVIDCAGFHGAIKNRYPGKIYGERAAIDIDSGVATYSAIWDVTITNGKSAEICGSIIIPDIQGGALNNSGLISPYSMSTAAGTMELILGGFDLLDNRKGAILKTYNLIIGKTNKNAVVKNKGTMFITNILSTPKIINYATGILQLKDLPSAIVECKNYGIISMTESSSITHTITVHHYKGASLNANKSLTIDNRHNGSFNNQGTTRISSGALYSFNFTNRGAIFTPQISGEDLTNNGNIVGLSLIIDASVTNNKNLQSENLIINDSFKNTRFALLMANNLTIGFKNLINQGTVDIKNSLTAEHNGNFFNDVNATLHHTGENFYLHKDKTKIINNGYIIVDKNLILQTNITTSATYSIENLYMINGAELIKPINSYCYVKNIFSGIVQNFGGIKLDNVLGRVDIDYLNPVSNLKVSNTGDFHIEKLDASIDKSTILNEGTIIVSNEAKLWYNTIINNGNVISEGHTIFLDRLPLNNRGNFTFGNKVTISYPEFIFINSKAGKRIKFPKSINAKLQIRNQAILELDKPISIANYQGTFQDDIIINTNINIPNSKTYLDADNIYLFSEGFDSANPKTRIIINRNKIQLKKKTILSLLQADTITGIYTFDGSFKNFLYGDINYISQLNSYNVKDVHRGKKLVLLASNRRIIKNATNKYQLLVDCSWDYVLKGFYKADDAGIYSMDYINYLREGNILLGINFDIFCDGIKQWYIDRKNKSKLYIGRASSQLPRVGINLVAANNIPDVVSITSLDSMVAIGYIEVQFNIIAHNSIFQSNALAIRSRKPVKNSYIKAELPEYAIYIIDKLIINRLARLEGGQQIGKSGLELACLISGDIENHGIITGYNGINIVGPLNYLDGTIKNYGEITANRVINTHMDIPYDSDKDRKCIITNYKKMQGDFILGGYNCDFINKGTVTSTGDGIIGRYSNNNTIDNQGYMKVSHILIEDSTSTLNLINSGTLLLSNVSVLNKLTNSNYVKAEEDLIVIESLSNYGLFIASKNIITSANIQLKYDEIIANASIINSGTMIFHQPYNCATKLYNQSTGVITVKGNLILSFNDFLNGGKIYADGNLQIDIPNIQNDGLLSANILYINKSLESSSLSEIHVSGIQAINNHAYIKGDSNLFINNKVINFNDDLDINVNSLVINANKIEVSSKVNINTDNLNINNHDNKNPCLINIKLNKQLTLINKNSISKNISVINDGKLNLKGILSSLSDPLSEIVNYTGNRGANLRLELPDMLSHNKEITDLTMPFIKVKNIAKFDQLASLITLVPTGVILRDAIAKIIIIEASALNDKNDIHLVNAGNIINKSFSSENIELKLSNIKVENHSITAIANLIDKRSLGPHMRRARQLLSSRLLGESSKRKDEIVFGVAFTYNHKINTQKQPINSVSLTSAYTDNLILYPMHLTSYGLNFNAQQLIIKPDYAKEVTSLVNLPALIIGTEILQDKFFVTKLNNYIEFDSIKLDNIHINGKIDYRKQIADADGLVIAGSNDLRLTKGITIDKNTELSAGSSSHAFNIGSYYIGDIINNGIIGDGLNYSGIHLTQPIEGTLVNNNSIIANINAIDIVPLNSWRSGSFKVINNGKIEGNIEVKCDSNISGNLIEIVNNGIIIAKNIKSYSNNIDILINNRPNGILKITGLLKISYLNLINNGTLEVDNLLVESTFMSNGIISANYLNGNNYNFYAPSIKVKKLENIDLSSSLVEVSSLILNKVRIQDHLKIIGNVENRGNLTTTFLLFATDSNITNNGTVKIEAPIVELNNSTFKNLGDLEINSTLKLTGNFDTLRGKLLVHELDLNGNNIKAGENATISCDQLITSNDSHIVIQKGSTFELGYMAPVATISGNISFSDRALSSGAANKFEASLKFKEDVIFYNGLLQVGNIITNNNKLISFAIKKQARALFHLPIQETKLQIINNGLIKLVADNNIYSYTGEDATIEMYFSGDNHDTFDSFLTLENQILFNANSKIKLKPSIDAAPMGYTYTTLITTPLKEIKYNSSGINNITTENISLIIEKEENNKRIIRLKDIKVTHTSANSIISAMVGIRNITNFPSYMEYLDQKLYSNLLVSKCCDTSKIIEGIAWNINYQSNKILSNNLIISPYNLVDLHRIAKFNINNKNLYLLPPTGKIKKICITDNIPAVVIGTEVTSTDVTQEIISNQGSVLTINSIFIDKLIIDGGIKTDGTRGNQDGLLITGRHPLHLTNMLEIGASCTLNAGNNRHPLHIATDFKGDINNYANIGGNSSYSNIAILISQPYSGTITNYNNIEAKYAALVINSESDWDKNKKLNLVNKGKIIGGIIINKSSKAKQEINVNLINYGSINNYDDDDKNLCQINNATGTILNIYNKNNASIYMKNITAIYMQNKGYVFTSKIDFNKLENHGYFFLQGTTTLEVNDKNLVNKGLLSLTNDIKLTGNFTNNGTIETSADINTGIYQLTNSYMIKSTANINTSYLINATNSIVNVATLNIGVSKYNSKNYGDIFVNNFIQQGTLINNNNLHINNLFNLTSKIINNGALDFKVGMKLADNYSNNGYIKTNLLDGRNLSIINTNAVAKIKTSKIKDVIIKGLVIVTNEITGTVNITDLYSTTDIYQYGNLKVNKWLNKKGKIINYGTATIDKFTVNRLLNYGSLTVKILDARYNNTIKNYGSLYARSLNKCTLHNNSKGYAVFKNIDDSTIINYGILKVNNSLVNKVIIEGKLHIENTVTQKNKCEAEFIEGDNLEIYGTVKSSVVNIKNLYNDSKAILSISDRLTIDTGNKLNNYGYITTAFMTLNGLLHNHKLASLHITEQDSIYLSAKKCINNGSIHATNNIIIKGDFIAVGTLTAKTLDISPRAKLINKGNIYLSYIRNKLFSENSFKNNGYLTVANDIILQEKFINDGVIYANNICGLNTSSKFINNTIGVVKVEDIKNIQVVNKGVFTVKNSILGEVRIIGCLTVGGSITQQGNLFIEDIQAAKNIANINLNIQDNSFVNISKPVSGKKFNVVNNGCLYILPKSKFNSYTSRGGILKIYLPKDLAAIKAPLLSVSGTVTLKDGLNERPLIVLLAEKFNNISTNQVNTITILEANKILLNEKDIQQQMLKNVLAIQDGFAIDDSLISNSILLHFNSYWVNSLNKVSICATVYWEKIKNIKGLLSRPLSLSKLAELLKAQKDILQKKEIVSKIKDNTKNKNIPRESYQIAKSLSKVIGIDQVLLLPFPENSFHDQELIINTMNQAIASLDNRLMTDRFPELSYNNKYGINSGSIYNDLYIWSSFSYQKKHDYKKNLSPYGSSSSSSINFGMDNKFSKQLKIGFMLANISANDSTLGQSFNSKYNVIRDYKAKGILGSLYVSRTFDICTLNIYLNKATYTFKQKMNYFVSGNASYDASLLGLHGEFIYPFSYKNFTFDFAELIRINTISLSTYNFENKFINYGNRYNVVNVGFCGSCCYSMLLNLNYKLYLGCSLAYMYNFFTSEKQKNAISYFDNNFNIMHQNANKHEIKINSLFHFELFDKLKITFNLGLGFKSYSRYFNGNFKLNYSF